MADEVPIADRMAVEDVLGRYLLAVDTRDLQEVLAQFAPDAVVRYGDGTRYEGAEGLRDFALRAIGGSEAHGRMHVNSTLFAQRVEDEILLRSYLVVPQVQEDGNISVVTMRYTEDRFRKCGEGWRIRERAIFPWNEAGRSHAARVADRGAHEPS